MSAPNAAQQVETLYAEHHGWLQQWLRRRLGNVCDAADIAHDTFLRLLVRPRELPTTDDARAFLRHVGNGLCIDLWRRREVERAWLDAMQAQPARVWPSAEQQAILIETLVAVGEMLARLSPKAAQAFILAQVEGWRYQDIATHLQVSERMVKKYLAQALFECALLEMACDQASASQPALAATTPPVSS